MRKASVGFLAEYSVGINLCLLTALLLFAAVVLSSCKKEPPVASFTCDKLSGVSPLTVSFTSTSTGDISTYAWIFGDGNTAQGPKPSNTYHNSGTFTASLTVTGPAGSNSTSKTITVSEPAPVAVFTSDKTSGTFPLTITFTSTSTGPITSYSWDFGDGGTSTLVSPSHTFNSAGTFSIVLTVTGPGGTSFVNQSITVTAPPAPVSVFTCDKTSGLAPLTVAFTSTSTGSITSYSWNFGDGGTSTSQNPSHTYTTAGTFTAALTVTGPGGSNTSNKSITVTAPPAPVSVFTCDKTTGASPLTVKFTSSSTGTITSYAWTFGDGGTSTLENPSHTFSAGSFTVTLTVTGPGGSDSSTKIINAGTDITFNNPVFTDIKVTVNSVTKTITPGGSVTFPLVGGTSVSYTANTSGTTTGGTQVGLSVSWGSTLTLTGVAQSYDLNLSSTYFFLYITNSGVHTLASLYVNYGLVSQTYDNIVLSNNSVKTRIGYYKAFTNSNVRMYWQGSLTTYVYWNQGTHFTLPWTNNQYASLTNNSKSSATATDSEMNEITLQSSNVSGLKMVPAQPLIFRKDPKAIDLFSK